MEAGILAVVIIAVCHIPVIVFAIIGAIKLAKLKKDPNYRAEVKKKGINPIKMIPHLVAFAAMMVIGILNLTRVMSFGSPVLLYIGAPLFAASVVVTIIGIVKKIQKKKASEEQKTNDDIS